MAKYSELHLRLEMFAKAFHEAQTEENGNRVVAEMKRLIEQDADLLFEGVEGENGMTPGGFYAPDHRFYFHVFSGKTHLTELTGKPMLAKAGGLYELVLQNPVVGGFSLNHTDAEGAILITREELSADEEEVTA